MRRSSIIAGPTAYDRRQPLSREAWNAAARKALDQHRIAEVKIDRPAKRLEVTRGSFYFHFAGPTDLHKALLDEWRAQPSPLRSHGGG